MRPERLHLNPKSANAKEDFLYWKKHTVQKKKTVENANGYPVLIDQISSDHCRIDKLGDFFASFWRLHLLRSKTFRGRHILLTSKQAEVENINTSVTKLRQLKNNCKFNSLTAENAETKCD